MVVAVASKLSTSLFLYVADSKFVHSAGGGWGVGGDQRKGSGRERAAREGSGRDASEEVEKETGC